MTSHFKWASLSHLQINLNYMVHNSLLWLTKNLRCWTVCIIQKFYKFLILCKGRNLGLILCLRVFSPFFFSWDRVSLYSQRWPRTGDPPASGLPPPAPHLTPTPRYFRHAILAFLKNQYFFLSAGKKHRTSNMLGKHSTIELHPQPLCSSVRVPVTNGWKL
jgi:hypothetical protein